MIFVRKNERAKKLKQDKLFSTIIDEMSKQHQPICLELPNSAKTIVISQKDYNSMLETLHLLSNPN